MNELQLEGADVYMSTFAALKSYPFFREVQNWFYPFSKQQSDVIKQLKQEGNEKNTLLDLILQSGFSVTVISIHSSLRSGSCQRRSKT